MDRGISDGFVPSGWLSRTPQKSMQARLSMEIVRNGDSSVFIRTAPGRFFLRELLERDQIAREDPLQVGDQVSVPSTPYAAQRRAPPQPSEAVLCLPRHAYSRYLRFQGIRQMPEADVLALISGSSPCYVSRIDAENDPRYKQLVTYSMLTHRGKVLSFRRGQYNRVASFLKGSKCIGFGGHITESDRNLFSQKDFGIAANLIREASEELHVQSADQLSIDDHFRYVGLLNDDSSDVGKKHLAILLRCEVRNWSTWQMVERGEQSISQLEWVDSAHSSIDLNEYEYWSQLLWRDYSPAIAEAQPRFRIVRKAPFRTDHILIIAGTIGSGKSSTTKAFASRYGYQEINTGRLLAELLGISPVPKTAREEFQNKALAFINSEGGPVRLAQRIADAVDSAEEERVVIDGVRHQDTLQALKGRLSKRVALLYVHASPDIAFRHYCDRAELSGHRPPTPHKFMQMYTAAVEQEVPYMLSSADAILYNWTGQDEYERVVDELAAQLSMRRR